MQKLHSLKQCVRTTCFSHKSKTANIKKVVLLSITSPKCQCDAKQYNTKWRFSQKWGSKYYFLFSKPPKGTSLRGTVSFDVFCVKISFGPSAVASLKNQKKRTLTCYISRIWGEKTPWSNLHKILHWGDIENVITDANLGEDRLSRFCVARGQILGFSIGFRSRPYNTLALPCECVIPWTA